MLLDEENYKEKIHAFTLQDWQPLLALIPVIESTKKFSTWPKGGMEVEKGVFCISGIAEEAPVLNRFREIVYTMPIMIAFDWGSWDEGHAMAADDAFDYDSIDIPTKCKLITAFVRNDRFCEGALAGVFENGLILKILKSIEKQLTGSDTPQALRDKKGRSY